MTARRAGASAVALTVLAVGVMLLMVMFAARSGPKRIFAGPLHDPSFRAVNPSYTPPTTPPQGSHRRTGGGLNGDPFFRIVGILLVAAFVVLVAWLVYHGVRRLYDALRTVRRRSRKQAVEHVDFEVLDDPAELREELRRGADEQLELLLGGSPRNAIVACWDRFEDYAERVDAARKYWETSSEFTLRLLDLVSADPAAVSRLETLYREARFSDHEIDEERRTAAIDALHAIHRSLGIAVTAP